MPTPQAVRDTVQTSGLVSTILAPFIHFGVTKIEASSGMPLGTGYEAQVLMGIGVLIQVVAAHYRASQTATDPPVSLKG